LPGVATGATFLLPAFVGSTFCCSTSPSPPKPTVHLRLATTSHTTSHAAPDVHRPLRHARPRDETSMANIKSQIKRNRQNQARFERNRAVRTRLKTFNKRFDKLVDAGDKDAAAEAYRVAAREFDRAATKGVIHPNKAANKKSGMAKRLQTL
jgi:small subunit ribosomal protein S20